MDEKTKNRNTGKRRGHVQTVSTGPQDHQGENKRQARHEVEGLSDVQHCKVTGNADD